MTKIEAKALDPDFWKDWDETPEWRKMEFHYRARILKLDDARVALGLPEGTKLR